MTQTSVSTERTPGWHVLLLPLLLLLFAAAFIRLSGAGNYYYSQDESEHVGISSATSLSDVLDYAHYETHPPMLYILTHYWMMFSTDPAFVRGLQLIFGLGLILLHFRIGLLLKNELTGFCCAALVAFSYGAIIQSYVVRHYTLLAFFLSSALYFYLRWRVGRNNSSLIAYGIFAALACMTHFSGMFAVLCFVISKALDMLRRRTLKLDATWAVVNVIVLLIAAGLYIRWQSILGPVKHYFSSTDHLIFYALSYPLSTASYIFPALGAPLAVVILLLTAAFLPKAAGVERTPFRISFSLAWIALFLGMLLVATSLYPFAGTRRSFWTLPFLIPPVGYVIAIIFEWLGSLILKHRPLLWTNIAALLVLAAGWASYDPAMRFRDSQEYAIPIKQWQADAPFLASLGPTDLIITQKVDAVLFESIYPYLGNDPFTGVHTATFAPYGNSHILFNPYDQRMVTKQALISTLEEAQKRNLFAGITRLIFPNTSFTNLPIYDLMRCPSLEGKTFLPANADVHRLNGELIFMTVPADIFIRDVLTPGGKASDCLYPRGSL